MPRVNRDLQRRLAARRERERRRPSSERRYQFATSEPADLAADVDEAQVDGDLAPAAAVPAAPAAAKATATAYKPFTAYRAEYAYVTTDLRRVAVVVGSLLVALIILSFILPR